MADFDRSAILKARSGEIADRIEFIGPDDLHILDCLERGVLFVMAFWSVPSVQMYSTLMKVLQTADPKGMINILVLDTDDIEHLYQQPPFNTVPMGGWGETFWIRKGKTVMTARYGLELKAVMNQARLILADNLDLTAALG